MVKEDSVLGLPKPLPGSAIDAVLATPQLTSFPELSCAPVFRRQWPSLYEAMQDGALNRQELLKLEVENLPTASRQLLVGDHMAWSRPQARTLPDRSFEHQPTPIRGQKPQPAEKMTPGRVHQTMGGVLARSGTPASEPKPRGNSPGWSVGRIRAKLTRYEMVKKRPKETNEVKKESPTNSQASP